ncbi:MAG: hypothetical protein WCD49_01360 [Candidatus Acidiferrales bacterium]
MNEIQNRILGIVGRKGSGKTTRVNTLLKYSPRIFVWDPMEDHCNSLPDGIKGLDDPEIDIDEYFAEAAESKTFACDYVPQRDIEKEFSEICELVYIYGHMLFVIEEVPLVCKAGYMPPMFGRIVRTGRHKGIDVLWTAQRAAEVSRTLTAMTDVWILFSQTEPRDLDAIAERCGREIACRVAELGLHDFFVWDVIQRQIMQDSPRLLKRQVG